MPSPTSTGLRRDPRWIRLLPRLLLAGVLAAAGIAGLLAQGAQADPPFDGPVTVTLVIPPEVEVGQPLVPATLTFASGAIFPFSVTALTIESGGLLLAPAAIGTGPACPGVPFAVVPQGPSGTFALLPSSPIVLPPFADQVRAECAIQFGISVVVSPPTPVVTVKATVTGFAIPGIFVTVAGTATTRIRPAPVTVVVLPSSPLVNQGGTVEATATVVRLPSASLVPPPTGSVAFGLFGPDDPGCARPPIRTSGEQPLALLVARSPAYRPDAPGTYRWVARYSGDPAHAAASSGCGADVLVVDPLPRGGTTTSSPATTVAGAPPVTGPGPGPSVPDASGGGPGPAPAASPDERVTSRGRGRAQFAVYQPAAHAEEVVALQASAFALLALLGAAGGSRGSSSSAGAGGGSREAGELVGTEIESADEGLAGAMLGASALRPGDRSWTWRLPGTRMLDRLSRRGPGVVATRSPLLARVLDDAGYLRAIFGAASALLPAVGAALGALAVADVRGQALPPAFAIAVALAVLGVFDALAGLIGVAVFVAGVVLGGGVDSPDAARTLLGIATLWFAAPIIAGTARPLRRPATMSFDEHFDRTADVVIASLVGAWAVQKILQGLPGLSGLDLPIADRAGTAALIVLGALALRMGVETIAAHWYPQRLARVQPAALPEPGSAQRLAANLLVLAVFLFVAVSYLGSCWQLYVGGALFVLPRLLPFVADRLPSAPAVQRVVPKGIVQTVLLLLIGVLLGTLVLGNVAEGRELIRISFVVLSLPGFVVAVLEVIARDGPERELRWYQQLLGIPTLALGALLALGVVG